MGQFRTIFGFIGMLLFGVSALVWLIMVLPPVLSGGQTTADLGTLTFWTVITLVVWRAAAGKGWGFAAPPRDPGPRP